MSQMAIIPLAQRFDKPKHEGDPARLWYSHSRWGGITHMSTSIIDALSRAMSAAPRWPEDKERYEADVKRRVDSARFDCRFGLEPGGRAYSEG